MLYSLLIKLGMFALTMGIIVWIGWAVPQEQVVDIVRTETPATVTSPMAASSPAAQEPKSFSRTRAIGSLDLNRATEQEFESLPGIGSVLAGRIVEYRKNVGSFRSVDDLRDVKGIGKKKFDRIRSLVHVTASTPPARNGKRAT